VELAGGEVRELVAENFVKKAVRGVLEMRGDPNELALGIAPGEGSREAARELDAGLGGELGDVPCGEPPADGGAQRRGQVEDFRHQRRG
jgi:hypothetical protein